MALPVALILGGATELIRLGIEVLDAHNNGASQDELNAKWSQMQQRLVAANQRWNAAGQQPGVAAGATQAQPAAGGQQTVANQPQSGQPSGPTRQT